MNNLVTFLIVIHLDLLILSIKVTVIRNNYAGQDVREIVMKIFAFMMSMTILMVIMMSKLAMMLNLR